MIGRDDELALVSRMLTDDKRRIVTITGPGGVGKTRLAVAVAREVEPEFPDGVAFVDLARVRDPELVIDAVASAWGFVTPARHPWMRSWSSRSRAVGCCSLLDNVEHVVDAAARIAHLVANSDITVLATSRILLRVDGEQSLALGALPSSSAIELFAERARSVKPDFELQEANATDVASDLRRSG